MLLLIDSGAIDPMRLVESIQATFRRRDTHAAPGLLPSPPPAWEERFRDLAAECGLTGAMIEEFRRLASFLAGLQR